MTTLKIQVHDQGVSAALKALTARVNNLQPHLQAIGDDIVERAKRRFDTSSGPDGRPWQPNSAATLGLIAERLGRSHRKKDGSLNARGTQRLAGKKPLIGESGDLRQQIVALADKSSVTIGSVPLYAAIQQFGGKAGRGRKVSIPARPFLPIQADGALYPAEHAEIMAAITDYLVGEG